VGLILAILTIWPRPYHASALVAPDDSSAGLSGLFSGGGGVNLVASLLGGRGTIEADLLIGRSHAVYAGVAQRLHDQGRYRNMSLDRLETRLRHKVDVESARGSILQISIDDHDAGLAKQIIEDFVVVMRQRLTTLSRDQASEKRVIARERMDEATRLLEEQQQILNAYRASHHFSSPEVQQGFSVGAEVALQGQLEGAQATLATLEKIEGPDNIQVQTVKDRIEVLQRQIAELQTRPGAGSIQSLSQLDPEVTTYKNLLRNEGFAEGRYDIYKRYLESLTVQEVAAPLNIDVIDPPFVDPQRHFNAVPLGLLAFLIILAVIAEVYVPAPVERTI
jgi:capsule polysaccharide export protein KpsE/RkpR